MQKNIYLLLFLTCTLSMLAQQNFIPYRKGDKWGIYDIAKQQITVQCKYDSIKALAESPFEDRKNLSRTLFFIGFQNGKKGLVASNGVAHLACEYDSLGNFFSPQSSFLSLNDTTILDNGEYLLLKKDTKYGLFKKGRNILLPTEFDSLEVTPKIILGCKKGGWGAYNFEGVEILPHTYSQMSIVGYSSFSFQMGMRQPQIPAGFHLSILAQKKELWGIFDLQGKEILPIVYDSILKTQNAYVVKLKGKWGVLDLAGKTLLNPDYEEVMYDEIIRVKKNGKWGVISSETHQQTIPCQYDYIYATYMPTRGRENEDAFLSQYVLQNLKNELFTQMGNDSAKYYAFLQNRKNRELLEDSLLGVTESKYLKECGYQLNDAYIKVVQNGKMGIITKEGRQILPCLYEEVMLFHYTMEFWARQNKKWGVVNYKGEVVVPFQYDKFCKSKQTQFTREVSNEIMAEMEGKVVFLDKITGKLASPCCKFEQILNFDISRYKVKSNGKWGIINYQFQEIIPCEYDKIELGYKGQMYQVFKGNFFGYLDKSGKELYACEYEKGENELSGRKNGKYGIWGLLPFEHDRLIFYEDDRISDNIIAVKNQKMGMYSNGNLQIPFEYDSLLYDYSDKHAFWAKQKGKWFRIIEDKNPLYSFQYEGVIQNKKRVNAKITATITAVKFEGKWGVVNTETQQTLLPFEYENVVFLKFDSLVWVQQNGLWGLYNLHAQKLVLPCQYETYETFEEATLPEIISMDIFSDQSEVKPQNMEDAFFLKVKKADKWGLVSLASEKEVLTCKYAEIQPATNYLSEGKMDFFWVKVGEMNGWVDIEGVEYFE